MTEFEPGKGQFDDLIKSTEPTQAHAAIVCQLKDALSYEDAINALASYILAAHGYEHAERSTIKLLQDVFEDQEKKTNNLIDTAQLALEIAEANILRRAHLQVQASKRAKKAAEERHGQPGGSRENREKIQAIWAEGKYTSRDSCAEQEGAALGMSVSTARKALRGTPDPT